MDAGGSERQTLLLLRHLDRRLFQPVLFLTHHRGSLLPDVPDDVKVLACDWDEAAEDMRRGRTRRLNWPGRRLQQNTQFLIDCIRRERIDVVYDRTFHMTMLAGPAARRAGVPHVSTIVSLPERAFPLLERKFRWWKKRRLVRAYRGATSVIAVSDAVAASAIAFYGLNAASITTVHNPVDRARLLTEATQPTEWTPRQGCNLACVGRMSEEKGQADLVEALAQLAEKNWHLWLIGDGPRRHSLETSAEQSKLTEKIHFVGHTDHVAAIVARCQLLVLPSHFEGMPNVVLEAMVLGVPVIATDAGGTAELVGQGRLATLVPAANPIALRDAIAGFLRDPKPHLLRAQQAQLEVEREHSVERIIPRIEAILQRAAKRR